MNDLLSNVISLIARPVTQIASIYIWRNQIIIDTLKRLDLDPTHPPADFDTVYAYAVVEYGAGQPKELLELFNQEEIKQVFRQAFNNNNLLILLRTTEEFLDWNILGEQLQELQIDLSREITKFSAVFIEITRRTQTPAQIIQGLQIERLRRDIDRLLKQVERIPTAGGIRAEIARLLAENPPARSEADRLATIRECRAIILAQQMRAWFKTLNYSFEQYEVWERNYFEWIIEIQTRRGYDRILVRGIEGEVGVRDVNAIRESVNQHNTNEGWLVAVRRIASGARLEVEKEGNRNKLFCYTFDELIDETADFSLYFQWLKNEIKLRQIENYYVDLACTKEEVDPVTHETIAVHHFGKNEGWIDNYVDRWLSDSAQEHISVLGDYGTGKTWFVLHYAGEALEKYLEAKKKGVERPRLPLVIQLRDYAKAIDVENVLAGFFFSKHKILLHSEVFNQLNRMGKLLLIFDGFDEMADKVDRQKMINNFWELAKVVVPGSKAILTCRTTHFPDAKEGRALLNAELLASTANLTGEPPQFEVLELEKFNEEQIRKVLSLRTDSTTAKKIMDNSRLLELAHRPMMTELILEALEDIKDDKPIDLARVYLYAVRRKMVRDITTRRTFTSLADKLYFLCELSWEMLSTDRMSLNYRLFPERIRKLFSSFVQEQKELDHWQFDLLNNTMLIRNGDGDYSPAHKSLLEFFVAYKFAAELGILASDFTEVAQDQSPLRQGVKPKDYKWSAYFVREVGREGEVQPLVPLKGFSTESLTHLGTTLGKAPLTKAVTDLLVSMLDSATTIETLLKVIQSTRGEEEAKVGYVGGNAITLLVKYNPQALEGQNLEGVVVKGANFTNASLRNVNFSGANLSDTVFTPTFGSVLSLALSQDKKVLAIGDTNGKIHLWQVENSRQLWHCKGHANDIASVAFSPNGEILASGGADLNIKFWDTITGKFQNLPQQHEDRVRSVAFSPDGKFLVSASDDKKIILWDVVARKYIRVLTGHTDRVQSVDFSPDGKMLASGSDDTTVKIWNVETGQCLKTLKGHKDKVRAVVFSPEPNKLASAGEDKTIKIWDVETGQCKKTLEGHTNWIWSLAFSSDGKMLASGSDDTTVKIWNVDTDQCLKTLQGHVNRVRTVVWLQKQSSVNNPVHNFLFSAGDDLTVRRWDIDQGACQETLRGHTNWIRSVAFSPDGKILASASEDYTVKLWNVNNCSCTHELGGPDKHENLVRAVTFNHLGNMLASGGDDQTVKLWDVENKTCIKTFKGHTNKVWSVTFSLDDNTLASCSEDQTVKLWDVKNGRCLKTLEGHSKRVLSVTFSPDGKMLASSSEDKTVKLWDVKNYQCLKTLEGHKNWIRSVAFSPDSKILASCSEDRTVKIWNVKTGECQKTLEGHIDKLRAVTFNPDGKILATAGGNQTVRFWKVNDYNDYTYDEPLEVPISGVRSLAFSPAKGSQKLAIGCENETIVIGDEETGSCQIGEGTCCDMLRPDGLCEDLIIKGVRGLTKIQVNMLKSLGAK